MLFIDMQASQHRALPLSLSRWDACLVPVRRLPRPSRSMHFGDISESETYLENLLGPSDPETHRPGGIMRPRD